MNNIMSAADARSRSLATIEKARLALPKALDCVAQHIGETAYTFGRMRVIVEERDLLLACEGNIRDMEVIQDGLRKTLTEAGYHVFPGLNSIDVSWEPEPVEENLHA